MRGSFSFALAACVSSAVASPFPAPVVDPRAPPPAPICKAIDTIITILKVQKAAPFCSSFLSLSPVTVTGTGTSTRDATATVTRTITVQSTATVGESVTTDVTATKPATTTAESRVTVYETATLTVTRVETATATATRTATTSVTATSVSISTVWSTAYSTISRPTFLPGERPAGVNKRESTPVIEDRSAHMPPGPPHLPPWAALIGKNLLSTACSCFALTTSTVPATATVFVTRTGTQTASVSQINGVTIRTTATVTNPHTVTSTLTVTSTISTIIHLTQTSSATRKVTDTVTVDARVTSRFTATSLTVTTSTTTITVSTVYPCASAALANPQSGSYLVENPGAQVGIQTFYPSVADKKGCCSYCLFTQQYCRYAEYTSDGTCKIFAINGGSIDGTNSPNPGTCAYGNIVGETFGPSVGTYIPGPCGQSYTFPIRYT